MTRSSAAERRRFARAFRDLIKGTRADLLRKRARYRKDLAQCEAGMRKLKKMRYSWWREEERNRYYYRARDFRTYIANCNALLKKLHIPRRDYLERQYDSILAVPMVRRIRVLKKGIVVFTDVLHGRDPGYVTNMENGLYVPYPVRIPPGPWRRIGKIRLTISLDTSNGRLEPECTWYNPEHRLRQGRHAPQVGTDRTRHCYGSVADTEMRKAMRKFRIDALVALFVRFSECFTEGSERDDGNRIWPIAKARDVPEWYTRTWK